MAGAEDLGAGRLHAAEVIARSAMAAAQKVKDCLLLDKRTSLPLVDPLAEIMEAMLEQASIVVITTNN